jgi:hypothetical protein
MWRTEKSLPYLDSNSDSSVVQPNYTIPAPSTLAVIDIKYLLEKILCDSPKLYIKSATHAI